MTRNPAGQLWRVSMLEEELSAIEIGPLIRQWREERGVGLRELARIMEITAAFLSRVERGERPAPAGMARRVIHAMEGCGERGGR
jgi:predicted transcriptional regulator